MEESDMRKTLVPQLDDNARVHIELPMEHGRLSIDNVDACREMITISYTNYEDKESSKKSSRVELVIYCEEGSLAVMPTEQFIKRAHYDTKDEMYSGLPVLQLFTGAYDKICSEVQKSMKSVLKQDGD